MKMVFLAATFATIWYMTSERVVKQTYDKEHDTFRILFLIIPSFFLALLIHHRFTIMEVWFLPLLEPPPLLYPGAVDVFHLPRGSDHPTAARAVAANAKR